MLALPVTVCLPMPYECCIHHAAASLIVRLQNSRWLGDSSGGTGDVEPLVNGRVNGGGGLVLVLGDAEGGGLDTVVAVGNGGVGAVKC